MLVAQRPIAARATLNPLRCTYSGRILVSVSGRYRRRKDKDTMTTIPAISSTDLDSRRAWQRAAEEAIRPLRGADRLNVYLDLVALTDTYLARVGSISEDELFMATVVREVANQCANGTFGSHSGYRALSAGWCESTLRLLNAEGARFGIKDLI